MDFLSIRIIRQFLQTIPLLKLEIKERRYMKATGIVRRVDDLGRIVIPKEIRRTLRIREGYPSLKTLTVEYGYLWAVTKLQMRLGISESNVFCNKEKCSNPSNWSTFCFNVLISQAVYFMMFI